MSAAISERARAEQAPPLLNPEGFKQTASYLTPDVVATYLRTIAHRCETLLLALREAATPDANLAEAAHALAGSAGMFGFERVAALGRAFERAVLTSAPEIPILTDQFAECLHATLQVISERTSVAEA